MMASATPMTNGNIHQGVQNPLLAAYADLDAAKNFYYLRKREIEEVISLLQERVEAERVYA